MPHYPALDVAAMLLDVLLYFVVAVGVVGIIAFAFGVLFPVDP